MQRKAEVVDRVPADAPEAIWQFEITSRELDGLLDVGGPWCTDAREPGSCNLSWGAVTNDLFEVFRRAKLLFGDIPAELLRAAHDGAGMLVGRLRLTDADGGPLYARVRPPDITWTVE